MFSWIYASSTPAIIALLAAALFVAPPMAFADDDPPSAFVAEIDDRGGRSIAWNGETIAFAIDRDGDGLAEIGAWIFAGRVQRATVDLNRDGSADLLARVDEDGRATWHARAEGAWRPIPDRRARARAARSRLAEVARLRAMRARGELSVRREPSGPPGWIDANTANAPGGGETWRVVLVPHIAGDADAPVLGLDDPPRGGSIPVPLALPPIAVADGRATAARFMLPYAADAYAAGEKAGSATIDVFFASDFFAAPAPPGAETRWTTQTTLLACVDARLPGLGHGRRCVEFPAPGADRAFVPPPVGDGAGPRLGLEVMRVGSGEK